MTCETMSIEFFRSGDHIGSDDLALKLARPLQEIITRIPADSWHPYGNSDFWVNFFIRNDPSNANLVAINHEADSMTPAACSLLGQMHEMFVEEIRRRRMLEKRHWDEVIRKGG